MYIAVRILHVHMVKKWIESEAYYKHSNNAIAG